MRYREPKKPVFRGVWFKDVLEICAHLQAECRIKHARCSLIIMIIQKHVKRMPICFARDRVCAISIARVGLQMRYREPKKLVFSGVYFKAVSEICAHLQAECRIKHTWYSLIIMIIQKHVKRMPICFARDRVCVISIVHFYCGSGVCWIDCSRVSYVRLINQCGLYVDKIRIFRKK